MSRDKPDAAAVRAEIFTLNISFAGVWIPSADTRSYSLSGSSSGGYR